MTERKGPLESRPFPTQLDAHAVSGGHLPRLHGYDVEDDLAVSYRVSDLVYLSLTGELPDEPASRAFEVVMMFLAPRTVAAAPVHAALLARSCGARASGVLAVAAASLAEEATALHALCAEAALVQLVPDGLRATSDEERASVARLRALLPLDVPLLAMSPGRDLAIVAVLAAIGITTSDAFVSVVTLARLPVAMAEALPRRPLAFGDYPTCDAPPFELE